MSLDVNLPSDLTAVSELPSYIRANRVVINSMEDLMDSITVTTLSVSVGTTSLVIGTDLALHKIETIIISGIGASVIEHITKGTNGQIKIFISQDNDISFKDGVKSDGKIYLNQLPALTDFDLGENTVIALMNIGGDGATEYGYWKELWRQSAVK